MVRNGFWTTPIRFLEDTGHYIRRTVTYDLAELATGIPIGAFEAGTIPLHCHVTIQSAFDAGTTNDFVVGTIDDEDGFATAVDVAAGAVGLKDNLKGALTGIPLEKDEVVYAKYTYTGADPTAGKATVVMEFFNKREGEGIEFPNN